MLQETGGQDWDREQEGHRRGARCGSAASHHSSAQGPGHHTVWDRLTAVLPYHGLGTYQVGTHTRVHQGLYSHPQDEWLSGGSSCWLC